MNTFNFNADLHASLFFIFLFAIFLIVFFNSDLFKLLRFIYVKAVYSIPSSKPDYSVVAYTQADTRINLFYITFVNTFKVRVPLHNSEIVLAYGKGSLNFNLSKKYFNSQKEAEDFISSKLL